MYIKFTKKHPAGISKGHISNTDDRIAAKMIDEGFAKKSDQAEFELYKEALKKEKEKKAKKLQEESVKNNKDRFIAGNISKAVKDEFKKDDEVFFDFENDKGEKKELEGVIVHIEGLLAEIKVEGENQTYAREWKYLKKKETSSDES